MRPSKFALTIAIIIAAIWLLLAFIPGADVLTYQLGRLFAFLLKVILFVLILVVLLGGPWGLGALGKAVGVPLIDDLLDKDVTLGIGQRSTLGVLTALLAGALGIGVTMVLMNPMAGYNWLYAIFHWFGWSGVFEVPPLWMGIYWFGAYLIAWGSTEHEQRRSRY